MTIRAVEKALVAKKAVETKVRDAAIKVHVDSGAVKHDAELVLLFDAWLHAIDCCLHFFGFQSMEHVTIWVCYFGGRAVIRRAQIVAQHAADKIGLAVDEVEHIAGETVCLAIECRDWCQSPEQCEVKRV